MNCLLHCLLAGVSITALAQAQTAAPKPLVEKALAAFGGKDKPETAEGKKRIDSREMPPKRERRPPCNP